jgi:hypothetical protein
LLGGINAVIVGNYLPCSAATLEPDIVLLEEPRMDTQALDISCRRQSEGRRGYSRGP